MTPQTLGELLQQAMAAQGLTARQVAETVGCSASAVANYVADLRRPQAGRLTPLLDALAIHGEARVQAYVLADRPPVVS